MKAQPLMSEKDENKEGENENKKTLLQPKPSEWKLLGFRNSSMQLWTPGLQLSGCRMSLLSKRLLQQTGADVSGVIVPTTPSQEKFLQESKYETGLPKLKFSESISIDSSSTSTSTSTSASLSSSQLMSTSSSTSMFSSSMLSSTIATTSTMAQGISPLLSSSSSSSRSSTTTSSSSSTTVLITPGGPSLMPRPRDSITPRLSTTQPRNRRSSGPQCVVS